MLGVDGWRVVPSDADTPLLTGILVERFGDRIDLETFNITHTSLATAIDAGESASNPGIGRAIEWLDWADGHVSEGHDIPPMSEPAIYRIQVTENIPCHGEPNERLNSFRQAMGLIDSCL
ncbi:hypothetical protein O6R08_02620 [Cutibacterium equinum]|uniref:Uncharacterized protein n=1 Tax=Cutibacterium equinum TaxID=3016342 RepID=A0ABY7QZH4_9ACTN|nr:hypothetical protein [Cutibacterium equinum]WCC80436.1 hypothetical protein O6R08_02620 [Cutibacterium equinum]